MSKGQQYNDEATTRLLKALQVSDYGAAKQAIKDGANVNVEDKNGKTSLHRATELRNEVMVEFLVSQGADVNVENGFGDTPLRRAVKNNSEAMVVLFIKHGANVNYEDVQLYRPLHYASSKVIAELLLENGADVNARSKSGNTALHSAVGIGRPFDYVQSGGLYQEIPIAELLIENGAVVTPDIITKAKVIGKQILPDHFIAARWCQDVLTGQQVEETPSISGYYPPTLLTQIMKAQLAEGGSIAKLDELQHSENPTIQNIIRTNNFVEDTTNAIIDKHAMRLYIGILNWHNRYTPVDITGLDTLSLNQQEMVVNKVKSLWIERGITSYENAMSAINSSTIPDYVKREINKALTEGQEALGVVESGIMNHIYKDGLIAADAHSSATKIQKVVRGHKVRKELEEAKKRIHTAPEDASSIASSDPLLISKKVMKLVKDMIPGKR